MLKTNSKKAIDNIWKYLNDFVDIINEELVVYNDDMNTITEGNRKELATVIYQEFKAEKADDHLYKAGRISEQDLFDEWAQGLAMNGIFDYYIYRDDTNPVKILGDILEETEEERAKFAEDDAARTLTYLIYREVKKNI